MSLDELILFMEREIADDKEKGESHEIREQYQREVIEQLARLRDLED